MKKILPIMLIISLILFGCDELSTSGGEERNTYEDQEFLEEMNSEYALSERPENVLIEIDKHYSEIVKDEVKEQLVDLVNDAAIKILNRDKGRELNERNSYTTFFERNSFDIFYEELLTDEVKQKVYDELHPVAKGLLNSSYDIEFIDEFNEEVKINESIISIEIWLKDNEIKYDYIDKDNNHLLVMTDEDIVIHATDNNVLNIFKVKDSEGNTLVPFNILEDAAERIIASESESTMKTIEENRRKAEEDKKVKIGMTTGQVEKRMGDPQTINRTTTESYVKEQWVYNGGVYLYFEDGVLTTIQN